MTETRRHFPQFDFAILAASSDVKTIWRVTQTRHVVKVTLEDVAVKGGRKEKKGGLQFDAINYSVFTRPKDGIKIKTPQGQMNTSNCPPRRSVSQNFILVRTTKKYLYSTRATSYVGPAMYKQMDKQWGNLPSQPTNHHSTKHWHWFHCHG